MTASKCITDLRLRGQPLQQQPPQPPSELGRLKNPLPLPQDQFGLQLPNQDLLGPSPAPVMASTRQTRMTVPSFTSVSTTSGSLGSVLLASCLQTTTATAL